MANSSFLDNTASENKNISVEEAVRQRVLSSISEILEGCDKVSESLPRLAIQAACLDLVTEVEELIKKEQLN